MDNIENSSTCGLEPHVVSQGRVANAAFDNIPNEKYESELPFLQLPGSGAGACFIGWTRDAREKIHRTATVSAVWTYPFGIEVRRDAVEL